MSTPIRPMPTVEEVPIADLVPADYNPRTITPAKLAQLTRSLETFGWVEAVVVNRRGGNRIVGGHRRLEVAVASGAATAPVIFVDLDDAEERALNLALNNPAGTWDLPALTDLLGGLDPDTRELAGFGPDDIKAVLGEDLHHVEFDARVRVDVPPPAKPETPVTEPGDVWELGTHRVVCADGFLLDVAAINGGPVAMMLTDPPYAIFGSSTGVSADVTDDRMVRPFFELIARRAALALPRQGHAYIHCDWRSWAALWEGFRRGGLAVRNMLVWDKGGGGLGSNYANSHELIAFAHNVPKTSGTFDNHRGGDYRAVNTSNVLRENRVVGAARLHNAAKPVALLEALITNSSDPGDVVLDLFAGSGSTLIAAENTGRTALVVDVEPAWCDVIVERWRQQTGGDAHRRRGAALEFVGDGD